MSVKRSSLLHLTSACLLGISLNGALTIKSSLSITAQAQEVAVPVTRITPAQFTQQPFQASTLPKIELLRAAELGAHQTQSTFQNAIWRFFPDGRWQVTTRPDPTSTEPIILQGTYTQQGDLWAIQAEHLSRNGSHSIDGTVRLTDTGPLVDVLYTQSTRNSQQVARVVQSLSSQQQALTEIASSPAMPVVPRPDEELVDPRIKQVAGITLGIYDISLSGATEAQPFSPIQGQLFVEDNADSLSVQFNSSGEITNGWSYWGLGETLPDIKTEVNNQTLRLTVNANQLTQTIGWWTIPRRGKPDETAPAQAKQATLTLTFTGDRVMGELLASGLYSQLSGTLYNQPSTYTATITGMRQSSSLANQLRTTLGKTRFTGRWTTTLSNLGIVELQQSGDQVIGTYTGFGGGRLQGTVRGNRLELTWVDPQRGQGRGFFRAIAGGGTLVGQWEDSTATSQPILANWQLPPAMTTQALTPLDIQELRYLSDDLVNRGRCQQAIALLQTLANQYRDKRQKTAVGENIADTSLTDEYLVLNSIQACTLQVGDYNSLLQTLSQAVDLQQLWSPGETSRRTFRQLTKDIPKTLGQNLDLLKSLQSTTGGLQKALSFIGTGVQLQQQESTQAIVVAAVLPASPAEKAGIQTQDVVLQLDGKSVQGLSLEQVVERVRGREGTTVQFTIQRGQQTRTIAVRRTRIEARPKFRSAQALRQDIITLLSALSQIQTRLTADLKRFQTLEQQIASGQVDAIAALDSLTQDLDRQWQRFSQDAARLTPLSQALLQGQDAPLRQTLPLILAALQPSRCGAKAAQLETSDIEQLAALDERFESLLKHNQTLTEAEKYLLDRQLNTLRIISMAATKLDCIRNLVTKIDTRKRFQFALEQSLNNSVRYSQQLETWRKRLVSDTARIQAQEQGQPFFQQLIQFLLSIGKAQEALVISENSRARAFADLLALNLERQTSQNTPVAGTESLTRWQQTTTSISLSTIQTIAKAQNATLVQYLLAGQDAIYIWVVQPNGMIHFRQVSLAAMKTSLSQLVIENRNVIGARGDRAPTLVAKLTPAAERQQRAQQSASLKRLHQLLIAPIAALLPTNPNQRVIFIPQGELFLVPFPALTDAKGIPLIQKHTILTAPSIQVLELTRQQAIAQRTRRPSQQSVLVVGNPTMPKIRNQSDGALETLPNLPGAEQEAKLIANLLQTQSLIGPEATKSTVLQQLPQARIIHLATHGLLDDFTGFGIPGAIALAPDGTGQANDGLLTSEEILNLQLNAELVVLSACDTGRGRITGDGVIGLSRSLITAGVPRIIVSLWKVPDQSTAFLMTAFYQNLQRHSNQAQALREAMLATRQKYPNPLDWAAFTLIGEAQ